MSALWVPDPTEPENAADVEQDASFVARRPVLRGLPRTPPRLARVPFIGVLIVLFALGMTGLLMLNTTLQNQAFQASTLHRQANELAYSQADLESQLDQFAAPQELARRASAAGLRPNPYPAFLVLPQGKVLGHPRRVTGGEVPTLVVKSPEELAAERVRAAARREAVAARRAADAEAKAQRARVKADQAKAKAAEDQATAATKAPAATQAAARQAAGTQQQAKQQAKQPSKEPARPPAEQPSKDKAPKPGSTLVLKPAGGRG